jgi:TRAP-type C4-dicarboxylate transport system substrate-binding protein
MLFIPQADGAVQRRGTALTRRAITVAGLAAPLLPRFARAAEFTWRIGHSAPPDFSLHVRLTQAAASIASRSDGQVAVQVFPNSELGSPVGLLAQLRAGTVDAAPLTCQALAIDLPMASLPMVGFAFGGYDRLWAALDGDLGRLIRAPLRDRLGLEAMERCWDFGFRQIFTAAKSVKLAADLEGLRLRTPSEADFIELFQRLKALPIVMPLSGIDEGLRSHVIDGQESLVPLVQAAGLFRSLTVCALTNHIWDGQWLCVSGKSWAKLPDRLKDIVATALNEAGLRQREDTALGEGLVRKALESEGMAFNAVDTASFRTALRTSGYYAGWRKKIGDDAWAVLETYSGRLA